MAAGAFTLFHTVAELIADATIDLDNHTFKIALLGSGYTPNLAHDEWADVSGSEIAAANGYAAGGAALTGVTWAQTSGVAKFASSNQVWTAAGGSISARYAVIYDDSVTGKKLLGYYLLDTTPANLVATDGNTLTVGPHAINGWFKLTVNP